MAEADEIKREKLREKYAKSYAEIETQIIQLGNTQFKGYVMTMQQLFLCGIIARAYDIIGDLENSNIYANYVTKFYKDIILGDNRIALVAKTIKRKQQELTPKQSADFLSIIFDCLAIRAREPYCRVDSGILAFEYYRNKKDSFYLDRRNVLIKHGIVQDLQDLVDGKITIYMLNAPPGIGKTIICSMFMCLWFGCHENGRELLGTADSNLASAFYDGIVEMMTSQEYSFRQIFTKFPELIKEDKTNTLHFGIKSKEPRFLSRSVAVGATGVIHIDESGLIMIDDAVPGADEARNQDTLNKLYTNIKQTFFDRKDNEMVRMLILGTPWKKGCPLYQIEEKFKDNPNFRLKRIPAYYVNDNGDEITNFPYKANKFKSMKYWHEQIESDTQKDDYCMAMAKYMMKFISKEGNPFIEVAEFKIDDFEERIKFEPYSVFSSTDVATAVGRDFMASGYFYYFYETGDVYLRDIVYSNKGSDYTLPKIVEKHMLHRPVKSVIEEKQGENKNKVRYGITKEIEERCIKQKLVCAFKVDSGAGKATKRYRIEPFEQEIQGNKSIRGWRFLFLCQNDRKRMPEYNLAMEHLSDYFYETKKKDDFPDMLSICAIECISSPKKQKAKCLKLTW